MTMYQTGIFPIPSNIRPDQRKMIGEMEKGGCTVILEHSGDQHVVKVRQPGEKQIRTGSTSGFPIKDAFEKWSWRNWGKV